MSTEMFSSSGRTVRLSASGQPETPPPPENDHHPRAADPGFNADEASVTAITNFAADELGVDDIHFLPYHTLGMNKYTLLGQPYSAPDKPLDNPALLDFAQQYACQKGLTATLRG